MLARRSPLTWQGFAGSFRAKPPLGLQLVLTSFLSEFNFCIDAAARIPCAVVAAAGIPSDATASARIPSDVEATGILEEC